jgi:tRNA threonylcarbamoyladenosine biosynthesis protein TsaB
VIVGIEGASTELSVALRRPDGSIVDDAWTGGRRQSAELMPRLLALLGGERAAPANIDGVAVGTGPGSFTGLRVAMAVAKGLAIAIGCPIAGVPSLAAWLEADPGADAALARAGAREAYVLVRGEDHPRVVDRDELEGLRSGRRIAAPAELAEAFGLGSASAPTGAARAILELAAERLLAGAGDDLRRLEPIYLRAPRGVANEAEGEVKWL